MYYNPLIAKEEGSMGKIIMICGKLCSGKSTLARKMSENERSVILSIDEFMLALFGPYTGDKHDEYTAAIKSILIEKAARIAIAGPDVILDWGFWQRKDRDQIRSYFENKGIVCTLIYLRIDDETWKNRIRMRNNAISSGLAAAYPVDDGLMKKFSILFEEPDEREGFVPMQS